MVGLGYLFGIVGAVSGSGLGFRTTIDPMELLHRTPAMLWWSWINLLLFNLHNQRHPGAIREDKVNKPWRPLPAGRLSSINATHLMYATYPVVLLSSLCFGGLIPCAVEMLACLWYNEWMGAESLMFRNFLNAVGISCFLAGPLEIAIGGTSLLNFPKAFVWLVILGSIIFTTAHLQDFRDQSGDEARGRQTLPIVIGDGPARWLVVAAVIIWSLSGPVFWNLGVLGYLLPASTGGWIMSSLIFNRTVEGDKWTWKLWAAWMASFFFLPLFTID